MFLANEMVKLGLSPSRLTYDRLILVCLTAGDLDDAMLYYEEMVSTGATAGKKGPMKPRRNTWEALIYRCVEEGDERAVALLNDCKDGVEEPRRNIEKAVVERPRTQHPTLWKINMSGQRRSLVEPQMLELTRNCRRNEVGRVLKEEARVRVRRRRRIEADDLAVMKASKGAERC